MQLSNIFILICMHLNFHKYVWGFFLSVKLEASLSLDELLLSISTKQSNKEAGPDGFHIEFYRKFTSKLAPLLL